MSNAAAGTVRVYPHGRRMSRQKRDERGNLSRRMRSRRNSESIHLNIVPLVDVTFLLMIFFVIAGAFERWEGMLESKFPRTQGGGISTPLPLSPVTLRLQTTGQGADDFLATVDGTEIRTQSFEELATRLHDLQQNPAYSSDTPVVVMSEPRVRWDHVVNAWNAALRAGYQNVVFGSK
ncbi:MAG: biopolymer transporter ExbD [Planctomycetes bacterium]|nr:biopolymer transporter ExbD [Planctomycetota bacterium]MBI3835131.1 biopolymer transporter ExbD [Planctomycetota bacterium]